MTRTEGSLPPAKVAALDERRIDQRRLLLIACGLSLGVHVGLALGWMFAPSSSAPAVNLDDAVVKTRLVKLGKPRDETLLPRLPTSPPPPPVERKGPPIAEAPAKPEPASTKKPSAADILEKFSKDNAKPTDVRDLIRDRIGEPTDEGQLDGDKDGDALRGELQKTYFQQLIAHIRRRMEVSTTITDEERIRLKATLFLRVDANGDVLDATVQQSSGSSVFDSDVVSAARRASPMPAPPPLVRELAARGIGINFCPVSCS